MSLPLRISHFAVNRYRAITVTSVIIALLMAALAIVPSVWPQALPALNGITVDTDPENMLAHDEPVRVFNDHMKEVLSLHDMVVVGVINETHPDGVFNVDTLKRIYELTKFAKTLTWPHRDDPNKSEGVVEVDIIAPSTVDNIEPEGPSTIRFEQLMPTPPGTPEQARAIRDKAQRIPFLDGTLLSEDGKALAIYLPLTHKDLSHKVYVALNDKIEEFSGDDHFHITGLPVAEDTFGVEMFKQMAISAPMAMLVIFLLMLVFFRKLAVIISPMVVAMLTVIITMAALVISGFPVHIMSSMIPIFIMPIAVLDSVHIISEFFDRYQATRNRAETIEKVIDELFMPMLYTSLTSAAGFASLALTPIPPVQVFGVFVAIGVMLAWALTILLVPALVMFISPKSLENFGAANHGESAHSADHGVMTGFLRWMGGATYRQAKPILAMAIVVVIIAGYGISRIRINDNPTKWFTESHPIRVADRELNKHFGGTYMAYLALKAEDTQFNAEQVRTDFNEHAEAYLADIREQFPAAPEVFSQLTSSASDIADRVDSREAFVAGLRKNITATLGRDEPDTESDTTQQDSQGAVGEGMPDVPQLLGGDTAGDGMPTVPGGLSDDGSATQDTDSTTQDDADASGLSAEQQAAWDEALLCVDIYEQRTELFKDPEVLRYMSELQTVMGDARSDDGRTLVGKSNSLATIVKTVYRDIMSGQPSDYRIPDSRDMVAQSLLQFQSSNRPQDLWHFATPDYRTSSIWVQLKSGDNRDMSRVVKVVRDFMANTAPPAGIDPKPHWFGMTYINVVWQEKMVGGMLEAFAGSFLVVFLLMTILFRSALWGILAMIPLTVTIVAIYGVIGLIGKDYDMPVAVLSSLTLGLAVDFAIHFLARGRRIRQDTDSWHAAAPVVFGEPARAITRNVIVIATGFTPLLFAPLMPYKTVGIFLASILLVSGLATLLILPALVTLLEKRLFARSEAMGPTCNCVTCLASAVAVVALLALNLYRYVEVGPTTLTWISLALIPVIAAGCGIISRRDKCKITQEDAKGT